MDVLQRIFSAKDQFFDKTLIKEIKQKDIIPFFIEQVNNIETLVLQPLPESLEEIEILSNSVSNCLAKTIGYLDIILNNKLNSAKKQTKSREGSHHYWNFILSSFYNVESVRFVHNFYGDKYETPRLALSWLSLVLLERTFYDLVLDMYKQELDKKFYLSDSIIVEERNEILEISKRLSCLHIMISFSMYNEYIQYKFKRKQEVDDNIEVSQVASKVRKSGASTTQNGNLIEGFSQKQQISQANNNFRPTKIESSNPLSTQGEFNIYSNLMKKDTHSFLQSKDELDTLLHLIQKQDEHNFVYKKFDSGDKFDEIWEKNINSKVKVTVINPGGRNSDGTCFLQENQKEYNITRKCDINIVENHFNFNFEGKSVCSTAVQSYHKNIFQNKNFEFLRRYDQFKYTKRDTVKLGKREIKLTNSILFFLNHFYNKQSFFEFNTKLLDKSLTLEDQNNQCQLCLKRFDSCLTIPSDKIFWCSYFMRFVCHECYSDDYSVVPVFVMKFWDFSKFPISIKAREIIQEWFDKPIVHLKAADGVLTYSGKMKRCVVIKRKLHRIFDYMKCESAESFALQTLGTYSYLVLLENIFSLKDLCEINEGTFEHKLKEFLTQFENHIFIDCKICEYKGRNCMICNNGEKLMIYDVENVFFCKYCNTLNHKNCSMVHNCIIDN